MKNQTGIKKAGKFVVRNGSIEHIKKIGCMAQLWIRVKRFFAVPDAIPCCDNGWEFCDELYAHSKCSIRRKFFNVRVMICQHGNCCLKDIHGKRLFGSGLKGCDNFRGKGPFRYELFIEIFKFCFLR